ncbi:hypothetical protein EV426DRAFT_713727 [Tirmania nivea]|nr:hypothetical protein EV426DRAFT_713727 [Tirmania nivea]
MIKELDDAYVAGRISKPVATYDECVTSALLLKESSDSTLPDQVSSPALLQREVTIEWTNFYGEDADVFNPQRWLVSEERSKMMKNCGFTWGYGTRIFLGKNIALMEAHKAICQLFLHFAPKLVDLEQQGKRINLGE